MTNGQPTFKRLMWGFGVTLVYFVAGKFGLSLASVHASASAVWPPTGIAFSAFLLLGSWIWPWIFAGAFFVNITTAGSIATSLGIAAGNTLEGIVGAYLVQRYANGRDVFEQSKDIFKFVLLAGLLSTAISATIGVTSITLGGFAPWEGYRLIWLTWWLGDVVGNVVVAPLVVLWARQRRIRWNIDQAVEFVFLAGFLIAMSELAFGVWQLTPKRYPLAFLCVPPLVWTAFRFGPRETAAATALLAALAIRGTLQGMGPFGQGSLHESLLILQAFMGVNAIMALTLASVVAERRRAEKELVQARDDLEKRVEERTVQLVLTNKELQSEVSERRRAVDASKESEEKFRNLLELAPDALIMVNAEGMIQLVNSQAVKMFGYSKEELVGKPVDELLPARFRVKHQNHRQSYFLEPRVRPMGSALDLFALRHDGSEFPVEISLSPLNTGDGVIVTAALRDITDRRKSEEMIRMLAHTMTNMNECVTITDLENHIKFVNEAFLRTYGYEKDEILQKSVDILRSRHNREGLTEEIVEETLKHGWTGEILNVRRNGEEFPIRLSTSVIHDESGNPILLLGVSYDITEEKKLRKRLDEVQRQRTEDLQRFASSVQQAQEEERHRIARELHDDLGQRLSGMKLSLQVAEERMSKTRKRAPREIAGAKKQIDNMIGEIRRISANLRPTALDDFGLLIALRLLFREFEKMCNVKVNFEFASSLNEHHPPQIEIAIYRIIQEALSNVARHAAATTVTLQLGQKDGRILLLIADDGVGLKKGTSESGSPSHRGFGLLSMRERSEHLGGRFHIERDTMGGTRIQVEIPLQE